ncbi:M56 family metallopeptidase [Pseudoflavonifractor sp.]|jgi:beta-lactamase regulating signal transducer with metallopeptidase domain|uniref:M56 family metallopeptidase n=1 Tax=Pseudoflavonifractor sp. TaxID=1980281 RepID=UPI003D8A5155
MPGFLLTLAEITLTMSAVILLLLALGPVLARRYKIRWRYWVWLAVAVRLLIPVNFSLPNAPVVLTPPDPGPFLSEPKPQASGGMDATPVPSHPLPSPTLSIAPPSSQTTPAGSNTASPSPQASADNTVPVSQAPAETDIPSISFSLTAGQLLFCLWLAGAAGLTLWHLASHWRFRRYLRRWAEPVEDTSALAQLETQKTRLGLKASVSLARCTGVGSPMLAGLFHPVILLPRAPGAGGLEELSLVLIHELCHLRRRDILYKALLYAAGAFHWFNPLVWMMVRQGVRDMELCCDDDVSALLTAQERKHYAQTILSAIPGKRK